MTVYLAQVFLIGFLGLLIDPNRSENRKRGYLVLVFLILVIISGLRAYSVGVDTWNYVRIFNNIHFIDALNTRIEVGFLTYLKLLRIFSEDPGIMLFSSSLICVGAACLFTYWLSKDAIMSMTLYVLMGSYFAQMNIMRQSLALSISEIAFIIVLVNGEGLPRKIISGLLLALATSIHTVAFILFVPYVLVIRRNNDHDGDTSLTVEKALLRTSVLALVCFVGYSIVMLVATRLFPSYARYFNSRWSDSNYNAALFNTMISVVFAIAGAYIFGNKKLDVTQRFAAIMIGFSIVFNVLSMRMEIWSRLAGMFGIYTNLLWVSEFSSEIQDEKSRWILNGCVTLLALAYMLIILVFRPEWTQVVPYAIR